tara:strand:- start:1450 stop:2019 length:570 start_codon:yes stop_codon:yes gene_type:complete
MNRGSKKTLIKLLIAVPLMFGFGWALVPLYDVFCEVTGLNGKVDLSPSQAKEDQLVDGRDLNIQFISHNNEQMPWDFYPSESSVTIKTGKYYTATYYVKNNTRLPMVAQAVPSVAPSNAAQYLEKLECFCFEQQTLMPGEEALLPVKLMFDDDLPDSINNVVLSYTIFDITKKTNKEIMHHGDGQIIGS